MRLIDLLPPNASKDTKETFTHHVSSARPILEMLTSYIDKQIQEIDSNLEDTSTLENCTQGFLIGQLETRKRLNDLITLINLEEKQ